MSSVTKVSNKSARKTARQELVLKAKADFRFGRHRYVHEMDFMTLRAFFRFASFSANYLVEWATDREGRKRWLKALSNDKISYRKKLEEVKKNRILSQAGESWLWVEIGGDVPFTKTNPE